MQLGLNLLSVGCAGLNTVLGPWRPLFIAAAAAGQGVMWWAIELPQVQRKSALVSTALTVGMTLLPEMLYLRQKCVSYYSDAAASPWTAQRQQSAGGTKHRAKTAAVDLHLAIENMGCIACVTTIGNTIRAVPGVQTCRISLETGEAWVSLVLGPEKHPHHHHSNHSAVLAETGRELCDKVGEVGFPTTVVSITTAPATAKAAIQPASKSDTETTPSSLWRDLLHSFSAGLLSSSCCALQLGLNLLSAFDIVHVGCAGFNKVLGPARGVLRALTISWLSWLWYRTQFSSTKNATTTKATTRHASPSLRLRNRLVAQTAITVSLMFLPEALKLLGGPSVAPSTENAKELQFSIPGLGCEACETAATRIINRQSGVLWSSVDFEAGIAKIMVASDWNFDTDRLKARLEYAGYGLDDVSRATAQVRPIVEEQKEKKKHAVVEEVTRIASEDDWID